MVVVEVVAGEIGEDRDVERDSVNPLLLQCVRGNFHHGFGCTLAQRLVQNAIQLKRLRSRVRRWQPFPRDVIFDGPDQRALAASGGQNGFDQKRSGTFPIRAGDAGDGEKLGGFLIKVGAQSRQRATPMGNLRPRHRWPRFFGRGIRNDRNRTRRNCLIDKFISITRFTVHGNKDVPGLDSARVVFQPADPRVAALGEHFSAVQEFEESH